MREPKENIVIIGAGAVGKTIAITEAVKQLDLHKEVVEVNPFTPESIPFKAREIAVIEEIREFNPKDGRQSRRERRKQQRNKGK